MSKWILVTGGAKSPGSDIAVELAKNGFSVAIHYLSLDQAAGSVASDCEEFGVQTKTVIGDLSTVNGARELAERVREDIGNIYGVVNCVDQSVVGTISETSLEQAEHLFETNFFAPLALIQELLEGLKGQRGAVVNLGASEWFPIGGARPYYDASKHALIQITRSLAVELAPFGVRVNMLSLSDLSSFDTEPVVVCPAAGETIARTTAFLMSEQAANISGQQIKIMRGVV